MLPATIVDGSRPRMNALLQYMQLETMPHDDVLDPSVGYWWLAKKDGIPAAFLGMTKLPLENAGYLARVGVLTPFRGNGVQKHLMRVAEQKAKRLGWERLISTTLNNPPSANSFIACGWKTYEPQHPWGYIGTIYWFKDLE